MIVSSLGRVASPWVFLSILFFATSALAQDDPPEAEATEEVDEAGGDEAAADDDRARGGAAAAVEVIKIQGTKKTGGVTAFEAPVQVTAFNGEQLEALQFTRIENLTFSIPNVSLDDVGTVKGVANFQIRGLGANSSIPSIDPTVGLFVNGVYYGTNAGAVLDSFDLEAVEVLRGPQGILFGRNVTGGAVLLRTRRPGDEFSAQFKANMETGLEYRLYGGVDIPLIDETLALRVSGQWRDDSGWFTNTAPVEGFDPANPEFVDTEFGTDQTYLARGTLSFTPGDNLEVHVMYERGSTDAQGPASQSSSRAFADPDRGLDFTGPSDDFDFSIDEPGFLDSQWDNVFTEIVYDLGEGVGQITNILGWRQFIAGALSDIDAQPLTLFHAGSRTRSEQISNELRYFNRFADTADLTVGVYYFRQALSYRENRNLLFGAINTTLGGDQDQTAIGTFAALDYDITDALTILSGIRYTYEEKSVGVASFNQAVNPCANGTDFDPEDNLELGEFCQFDFYDDESWNNVSPKLGLQYAINPENNVYAQWTRGFRSGGYNLRNTSATTPPGPFDQEIQNVYEVGAKGRLNEGKINYAAAVFVTQMNDVQREVNVPDAAAGVVQVIQNTADATLIGGELEGTIQIVEGLVFTGSFGYVDSSYSNVRFDLNGDGEINSEDEDLKLPRLENITLSTSLLYDIALGEAGILSLRGAYAYRDDSFFTDNNFGLLPSGNVVDASIAFTAFGISDDFTPTITLYGNNLLDEAFLGGQTPLPATIGPVPVGGNFSPLKEGRLIGAELRFDI